LKYTTQKRGGREGDKLEKKAARGKTFGLQGKGNGRPIGGGGLFCVVGKEKPPVFGGTEGKVTKGKKKKEGRKKHAIIVRTTIKNDRRFSGAMKGKKNGMQVVPFKETINSKGEKWLGKFVGKGRGKKYPQGRPGKWKKPLFRVGGRTPRLTRNFSSLKAPNMAKRGLSWRGALICWR